ncbi:hypothetical protein K502DRAFT_339144 [Neoconidiobolus thromboides FSU 785]|nr:hypothetical protein K502DRAFT_339144 [Neoconidiobolus thromboides FSU 785]
MSDSEDLSININENFAHEYQKRKQNEDLLKIKSQFRGQEISDEKAEKILERKRKFGVDKEYDEEEGVNIYVDDSEAYFDTSEEEEDEQGELITKEVDSQLLKTFVLLKAKDESVYDKEKVLFDNKLIEEAALKAKKKKEELELNKEQVITLGGLKRDKLNKGEHIVDDVEDEEAREENKVLTHHEEQEKLKNELKVYLSAIDNNDLGEDEDEFFTTRNKTRDEENAEEEDYKNFLLEEMSKVDTSKKVYDQWANFKNNPSINKDDAFLMDYILNRGWIDKNVGKTPSYKEVVGEIESEEEIEKAETFEQEYNFRYEEPNAHQLVSFPRNVETSLRTKVSKKKKQRERKKERKELEKKKEEEEVRRQKNIKMTEIKNTIEELKKVTKDPTIDINTLEKELDVDFDPNTYDSKFTNKFNDDYYQAGESDNEKPVFDDDIDIGDLEAQQTPEEVEKVKQEAMKLLGELYKMDYEDKIDDLETRFKYRKVDKFSGGLEPVDILLAEEKDLNQIVPLRELAPYREGGRKKSVRKDRVKGLRRKFKEDGIISKDQYNQLYKKNKLEKEKTEKEKSKNKSKSDEKDKDKDSKEDE